MADDGKEGDSGAGEDATGGAVAAYQPFVIMEELLDKLKLLHYDDGFCRQLGLKPFSRYCTLAVDFWLLQYWLAKVCKPKLISTHFHNSVFNMV